jgi:general secretion pathway protein D
MNIHFKKLTAAGWSCVCLSCALVLAPRAEAQQRTGGGNTGSSRTGTTRTYPGNGAIGDAYFSIDPETRRVVTIADEDTSQYISQVLSNLDRPKPQVLIKVVFLEVLHNNALDIGIEGGWGKTINNDPTKANAVQGFGLTPLSAALGTNLNQFGQPIASFATAPGFTAPGAGIYQILGADYQVTLKAIAQAGKAKILSRPSILARNNQPATITVGQSVPLITSVRYDTFGNAINSVTYTDVGVILKVTPFITPDNLVEMIISPQISSIDPSLSVPISANVNAPVIDVRSADTVAVTPDGQTVIIGGLIADTKSETDTKIPFLGDIPVLGNLFKHKQKSDSKTELLIFLTPHIVQAPSQLVSLSETERQKALLRNSFSEEEINRFLDSLPTKPAPKEKGKP